MTNGQSAEGVAGQMMDGNTIIAELKGTIGEFAMANAVLAAQLKEAQAQLAAATAAPSGAAPEIVREALDGPAETPLTPAGGGSQATRRPSPRGSYG